MLKEEKERSKFSFTPHLITSNSKKRTLSQIVNDLYPKKEEKV